MHIEKSFFDVDNDCFIQKALDIFRFQAKYNKVYANYINYLGLEPSEVTCLEDIPFLPIQFFKTHRVVTTSFTPSISFMSSGTTGNLTSFHHLKDLWYYQESFVRNFKANYGNAEDWVILALLPSYLDRLGSSLIYMVRSLINQTKHQESGFYLNDFERLKATMLALESKGQKVLLIGVAFALLDFVLRGPLQLKSTVVMETGGMKGRRKELVRADLHQQLMNGFGVANIHSEYGMTELLSQAYSKEAGIFETPPWMRVFIREGQDPFTFAKRGSVGGINVIDLANVYSCSFIATEDLGKQYSDGAFEVLGRFDEAQSRGCNLMVL